MALSGFFYLSGSLVIWLFQPSSLALTYLWASYFKLQWKTIKCKCKPLSTLFVINILCKWGTVDLNGCIVLGHIHLPAHLPGWRTSKYYNWQLEKQATRLPQIYEDISSVTQWASVWKVTQVFNLLCGLSLLDAILRTDPLLFSHHYIWQFVKKVWVITITH